MLSFALRTMSTNGTISAGVLREPMASSADNQTGTTGASMLFVTTTTEKYRLAAESSLRRAALMPIDSWERQRLITAAKLNNALASRIDGHAKRAELVSVLSCRPAAPPRSQEVFRRACLQKVGLPVATRYVQHHNVGSAPSS